MSKRLALIIILVAFIIGYGVKCVRKNIEGNDFAIYQMAARELFSDSNIYRTATDKGRGFIYPPFFALAMFPFGVFGETTSSVLWYAATWGLLVASAILARKTISPSRSIPWWGWACALLLTARAADSNFANGQSNWVPVFLLYLALFLFMEKREWFSGATLAAAIAAKVTPALFVLYFAYKRQWRVVAAAVTGLILFFFVLPSVFIGPGRNVHLLGTWYATQVEPYLNRNGLPYYSGQSLGASVVRFLLPGDDTSHDEEHVAVNLVSASPKQARLVITVLSLAILTGLALVCYGSRVTPGRMITALEFSVVMVGMLALSPVSRKAHFVLLLFPYLAALQFLRLREQGDGARKAVIAGLVCAFVGNTLTSSDILGKGLSTFAQAFSLMLFSTLVFGAMLGYALISERGSATRDDRRKITRAAVAQKLRAGLCLKR